MARICFISCLMWTSQVPSIRVVHSHVTGSTKFLCLCTSCLYVSGCSPTRASRI
ncbi:hypothetical protein PF008_g9789 [Phytophthora fragariae]|uniref:Uncharacterized protein n=1 Tax=Phytophthora fragariae TaxID=53985 RepID=A0A6G0RVI2_9STRA|nr:hypothetical protein PF008_g9789 [Phytophthora fragariae]